MVEPNLDYASVAQNLVRIRKQEGGKNAQLSQRELQAVDLLVMNYSLLKGDYESLRLQNEELAGYKHKYEQL